MQLQNASSYNGYQISLSANVTWSAPLLPGEPPGVLRSELAVCIPSNVDLASTCCSAVNGRFVRQELSNITQVDDAEVRQIYEDKYPGQNLSIPTSTRRGDLVNATGAGEAGAINWCSMAYNPLSDTALVGTGYVSGGGLLGNVPQSMQDWIACFENNTSAEARSTNQAVYLCTARDVMTGGEIEGYNRTYATKSIGANNGGERGQPTRWAGVLGVALVAGIWAVCV